MIKEDTISVLDYFTNKIVQKPASKIDYFEKHNRYKVVESVEPIPAIPMEMQKILEDIAEEHTPKEPKKNTEVKKETQNKQKNNTSGPPWLLALVLLGWAAFVSYITYILLW